MDNDKDITIGMFDNLECKLCGDIAYDPARHLKRKHKLTIRGTFLTGWINHKMTERCQKYFKKWDKTAGKPLNSLKRKAKV